VAAGAHPSSRECRIAVRLAARVEVKRRQYWWARGFVAIPASALGKIDSRMFSQIYNSIVPTVSSASTQHSAISIQPKNEQPKESEYDGVLSPLMDRKKTATSNARP